ncbi:MAG: BsaA family SipW-dependent biofilm matrix protein [Ruminococcus sp.]|nr:BsaA family SipW-dependent biofilm matrix protein [Ruminococcus sp.]
MSSTVTQRKKKTSRQKRAMVASLVIAAVIAMGSTFAWFTSKDKVTNELSAKSTYDVSIVETYNPPTNPTPGTSITKEVAAVNTGNTAAYVQVSLENALSVTNKVASASYMLGKDYTTVTTIPTGALTIDITQTVTINGGTGYTAVQALQAGGQLVYAAGTLYSTGDLNGVNSETYTPSASGLYVFYRNTDDTYVGYYYDSSTTTYYEVTNIEVGDGASHDYTNATYWKFSFVTTETKSTSDTPSPISMTFSSVIYSSTSTNQVGIGLSDSSYIQAIYDPDSSSGSGDEIIVDIALAGTWKNVSSTNVWVSDDWAAVYVTASKTWTFYYKHILSAGTTSEDLVTSMMIDESVTSSAYTEFTYDLNVSLESVQVVGLETSINDVYLVEIPSSSITWDYTTNSTGDNKSAANNKTIYVNSEGQVCTSIGTVTEKNNLLSWTKSSK